jgi:hypothetical protein
VELFLEIELSFKKPHDEILDRHRTGDVVRCVGFGTGAFGPLEEFAEIAVVSGPERFDCGDFFTHPGSAACDIRWIDLTTETDSDQRLVSFLLPFIRNTDDGVGTFVVFENSDQLGETPAISRGHAVDFVEDDSQGTMPFGSEKVADVRGVQQRFDEFGHSGFVSELRGVTFYGSETGIVDNAMG